MTEGFRVDPDALDAHALRVDLLAGQLRLAAVTGRPLGLSAYGIVGQVFALAAAAATNSGSVAVAGLAARATVQAAGIRAAGYAFRDHERSTAAGFGGPR
jgi:hypothetical protein